MKVAILGTGGVGRGYAASLLQDGHDVALWSPTGSPPTDASGVGVLAVEGMIDARFAPRITTTSAQAIDGADAIIVAVVANGLRRVCDELAPALRDDQIVIFSAHCSFAALYLAQLLKNRDIAPPIVAWSTTALTARRVGATGVSVSGVRAEIDMATLPVAASARGLGVCEALFGLRFRQRDDALAIMLSNLNPPVHMASMIANMTRAEKGEDWPNYGSITPAVGRIVEALEKERLALAQSFGLEVRTVQDHYVRSFGVAPGSMAEMAAAVYRKRPELMGPKSLDTRFITEDAPFGLYPLEILGRMTGVPTKLHSAGLDLLSAACGRDFRGENDLVPALGLDALTASELHQMMRGSF